MTASMRPMLGGPGVRRKSVPSDELTILPSLEDYVFFEQADAFPFEAGVSAFSVVNAWWAAEASMLAYREPDAVAEVVDEVGLMHSEAISHEGTRCYLLHDDRAVLVAFRDTACEACDALSEAPDFSRGRMRPFRGGGLVHAPFADAVDAIARALEARVHALRQARPERPVWMVGHGHGGALATLAAMRVPGATGAYSFGSPRFGDPCFARSCPPTIYRVVHSNDYAPRLPPELPAYVPAIGGRTHVGELRYIDRRGRLGLSLPDRLGGGLDRTASAVAEGVGALWGAAWSARQAARPSSAPALPWAARRDHAPIYYAVHLWNALVEDARVGAEA